MDLGVIANDSLGPQKHWVTTVPSAFLRGMSSPTRSCSWHRYAQDAATLAVRWTITSGTPSELTSVQRTRMLTGRGLEVSVRYWSSSWD